MVLCTVDVHPFAPRPKWRGLLPFLPCSRSDERPDKSDSCESAEAPPGPGVREGITETVLGQKRGADVKLCSLTRSSVIKKRPRREFLENKQRNVTGEMKKRQVGSELSVIPTKAVEGHSVSLPICGFISRFPWTVSKERANFDSRRGPFYLISSLLLTMNYNLSQCLYNISFHC